MTDKKDPVFGLTDNQIENVGHQIATDLAARDAAERRVGMVWMDGRYVRDDWDDELFLSREMYDQWLQAVQQDKVSAITRRPWTEDTQYHQWLGDALITLEFRKTELKEQRARGDIDVRTYQVAKELAERAEGAIRRFLEKTARQQLIGV